MKTDNFHLEIIPIEKILPHEKFDFARSDDLLKKIKKTNLFTDPIIVTELVGGYYLQLDGMNRINCFKKLGIKTILAQIVDYNNQEEVKLSSWIHLFKAKREDFLKYLEKNKNLIIKKAYINEITPRYIKEEDLDRLVTIIDRNLGSFLIFTEGNFIEKIKRLDYIVSFYEKNIHRAILPFPMNRRNIRLFFCEYPQLNFYEYPDANLMVIFPNFTPQQVVEAVKAKILMPAGITRHLIYNRCLNINLPLDFFDNKKSLKELNKDFDKFLSKKTPRFYEESTIHFE